MRQYFLHIYVRQKKEEEGKERKNILPQMLLKIKNS
jgi:hypothetical protein